jgi:hypothetical protein
VIGYLGAQSADEDSKNRAVRFLQSLKEASYVEGQNVVVEYRYAEDQFDWRGGVGDRAGPTASALSCR